MDDLQGAGPGARPLAGENQRRFRAAAEAAGVHVKRSFRIAGALMELNFCNEGLASQFCRAFLHLEAAPAAHPDLRLFVWDGATSGVEPAGLPGEAALETLRATPGSDQPSWNPSITSREGASKLMYEAGTGAFTFVDTELRMGVYWVPDPDGIPYWDFGAPFRNVILWWLTQRGLLMVHGGAIGLPQGGLLLAGKGGSGKSTACLRSLETELFFAGDDYVCVEDGAHPTVHSLYGSGKIMFDNLARVPSLRAHVTNPDGGDEKALLYPAEFAPDKMVASLPLRAIVMPRVTQNPGTRLEPASATQALTIMAPSSMFQLRGERRAAFEMMSRLVRKLPSYTLELGDDAGNLFELLMDIMQ
jgi:hypothetical protein